MLDATDTDRRLGRLERRVERERNARAEAEGLLEEKSRELYAANQMLSRLAAELETRVEERTRELADARERALELADRDQLTGLANRACFARVLGASIEDAAATGQRFALALLDLDRFKEINDTLGHEAGDVFLRHVAGRLRAAPCDTGAVARLGGDEFAIVVRTDGSRSDLHGTAEALVAAVRTPVAYRGRMLEGSASVGIALFPDDADDADDLQRNADVALYRSKAVRSTYMLYDAEMGREYEARQTLGAEFPQAIRSGQIEAWFQPIVDDASGRATGVEALARWVHPGRGVLGPAMFLGLAEERGLMPDLFARVMRSACPAARRWIDAGRIQSLSVNVSPSQFKLGSVADDVLALLDELHFPPTALTVEVTEAVLMSDLDRARAELERLAESGISIALDDFGVGYSNIGYLRQLPFHVLKLDRSLTADVTGESKVRSILSALVGLARALELQLVAEGVEDREQAQWLAHLGCRRQQGYLFGRPMPAAEFDRENVAALGPRLGATANLACTRQTKACVRSTDLAVNLHRGMVPSGTRGRSFIQIA